MTTNTAGIPGENSEINMAVRSGVPVAMDDATGRSTATTPPGDGSVLGNENFDMGGSETSLDFSVSPTKDKDEGTTAAPPASLETSLERRLERQTVARRQRGRASLSTYFPLETAASEGF